MSLALIGAHFILFRAISTWENCEIVGKNISSYPCKLDRVTPWCRLMESCNPSPGLGS